VLCAQFVIFLQGYKALQKGAHQAHTTKTPLGGPAIFKSRALYFFSLLAL